DDDVESELLRILEKANNGVTLEHETHSHVDPVTSTAVPDFQTVEKFRGNKKRKYRRLLKMSDRPESFGAPIFNPIQHVTRQPHFSRRTIPPPKMKTDTTRTLIVASPFYYPFGLPTSQSQQIATLPMQQMMQPFKMRI
ncbi:hypothetical protein OSTOST_21190, partial [Ostertagia ostertagi]